MSMYSHAKTNARKKSTIVVAQIHKFGLGYLLPQVTLASAPLVKAKRSLENVVFNRHDLG